MDSIRKVLAFCLHLYLVGVFFNAFPVGRSMIKRGMGFPFFQKRFWKDSLRSWGLFYEVYDTYYSIEDSEIILLDPVDKNSSDRIDRTMSLVKLLGKRGVLVSIVNNLWFDFEGKSYSIDNEGYDDFDEIVDYLERISENYHIIIYGLFDNINSERGYRYTLRYTTIEKESDISE